MTNWAMVVAFSAILAAIPCFAQMSPDEAEARLKERATDTTRPEMLQAKIDHLEREINQIAMENQRLSDQVASLTKSNENLEEQIQQVNSPKKMSSDPPIDPNPLDAPTTLPSLADVPAGNKIVINDVEVSVIRAEIGYPVVGRYPAIGDLPSDYRKTEDVRLVLWLNISNKSETRKIDYYSWRYRGLFYNGVDLADELGNNYRAYSDDAKDSVDNASIYPGKSAIDEIMFEVPVEKATRLILKFPGKNIGATETGQIILDISKIQRQS